DPPTLMAAFSLEKSYPYSRKRLGLSLLPLCMGTRASEVMRSVPKTTKNKSEILTAVFGLAIDAARKIGNGSMK
ncbi:unnamed protein product, partial [Ilex paraguariensis]